MNGRPESPRAENFRAALSATQWAPLTRKLALALPDESEESGDLGGSANGRATGESISALFDATRCAALLDEVSPRIGSPSRLVTASMLGKRHSFLATGASLYAMSVYDRAFDLSPHNTCIDATHDGKLWRSKLRLRNLQTCAAPSDPAARHAWRDAVIEQLFAMHLAPLWASFCAVSRLAPRILWENMAVRVYSLYEGRMPDDATSEQRARIDDDFAYLVNDAPGALFGLDHNPLARYFFAKTPTEDDEDGTRFRKTCCLYDKLPSGELCSTCPLLRKKA